MLNKVPRLTKILSCVDIGIVCLHEDAFKLTQLRRRESCSCVLSSVKIKQNSPTIPYPTLFPTLRVSRPRRANGGGWRHGRVGNVGNGDLIRQLTIVSRHIVLCWQVSQGWGVVRVNRVWGGIHETLGQWRSVFGLQQHGYNRTYQFN